MASLRTEAISRHLLRASSRFKLELFDRLSKDAQLALGGLAGSPDFYGVLAPLEPGLSIKAVSRDVALLFSTLQSPCRLPVYVRAGGGPSLLAIAELILDGVLEIEDQGAFVSGAGARRLLVPDVSLDPSSHVGRISLAALRYAQALPVRDAAVLSTRLYFYNRFPASPEWRRRLRGFDTLDRLLQVGLGDRSAARLDRHWSLHWTGRSSDPWLMWRRRDPSANIARDAGAFKLYLSPRPEALPRCVAQSLDVLSDSRATSFKVARTLSGTLRPDKFVAYFRTLEDLGAATRQLEDAIRGVPPHGVPFTAEIDPHGLLSWGIDPPTMSGAEPDWIRGTSWRLWVTNELAIGLVEALRRPAHDIPPWRFALDRLQVKGIDVATWTPAQSHGRIAPLDP